MMNINIVIEKTIKTKVSEVIRIAKNIKAVVKGKGAVGVYHGTNSRLDFSSICSTERAKFICASIAEADRLGHSPIYMVFRSGKP